jgi:ketosteroid isomerase-like protein
MVSRWSLVASMALFITLLAPPLPAQSKQPAAADEVARLRSEWAKDLLAKKLDQIVALYATDAVFLKPSGERVTGRAAIRDLCKNIMDTFTDSGDYRETLVKLSDATKLEVEGSYLMVFKRQSDGTWLILEQMWSLVTPATE